MLVKISRRHRSRALWRNSETHERALINFRRIGYRTGTSRMSNGPQKGTTPRRSGQPLPSPDPPLATLTEPRNPPKVRHGPSLRKRYRGYHPRRGTTVSMIQDEAVLRNQSRAASSHPSHGCPQVNDGLTRGWGSTSACRTFPAISRKFTSTITLCSTNSSRIFRVKSRARQMVLNPTVGHQNFV